MCAGGPAIAELDRQGLKLTHIFNTHHHPDHMGGNDALKARFPNAMLVGPKSEGERIPGMDVTVADGDTVEFGQLSFKGIDFAKVALKQEAISLKGPGDGTEFAGAAQEFGVLHL